MHNDYNLKNLVSETRTPRGTIVWPEEIRPCRRRKIIELSKTLPQKNRLAIIMRLAGYRNGEIALALGVTVRTIKRWFAIASRV